MDVAGAWYTSETFWTNAGAFVALLAAPTVVWVTFTMGFPRWRLCYGLRAAAPLLSAPAGVHSDLELRHRGVVLADPHVLTVELVSCGRKDIPSDAYDGGQPLQLDVGGRIVEILQVSSEPSTWPAPQVVADGTSLRIGPSLLGRCQEIRINVLTDGGTPALACRSPLIGVQVRQRSDEGSQAPATVAIVVSWVAAGVSWVALLVAMVALMVSAITVAAAAGVVAAAGILTVAGVAFAVGVSTTGAADGQGREQKDDNSTDGQ